MNNYDKEIARMGNGVVQLCILAIALLLIILFLL